MAHEKTGGQTAAPSQNGHTPTAQTPTLFGTRAGQSSVPEEHVRTHTLVVWVNDRPGSVDRVVGLLRRRRANMQTLIIGRGERPNIAHITAVTNDADVEREHLVEQMRKIVDVTRVHTLSPEGMTERELALIKVPNDAQHAHTINKYAQQCGARVAEVAPETLTFEISGSPAQIEQFVEFVRPFGIREMVRTGSIVLPRDTATLDTE